jgi:hypothetical protein
MGTVECVVCHESWSSKINHLTEPIDIYSGRAKGARLGKQARRRTSCEVEDCGRSSPPAAAGAFTTSRPAPPLLPSGADWLDACENANS